MGASEDTARAVEGAKAGASRRGIGVVPRVLSATWLRRIGRARRPTMKRRGGGGGDASAAPSNVVAADVDDRQLSAEASRRAANKAAAEAAGHASSAVAAPPLPVGLLVIVGAVLCVMVYLTIKFS